MHMMSLKATALFAAMIAAPLSAQEQLTITYEHGTPEELAVGEKLQQLVEEYSLSKWIRTWTVHIEPGVIPHSHPVLTLNTRTTDDARVLSTFVHEQFHWWIEEGTEGMGFDAAIEEFRSIYPEVPVGYPDGARSEFSTYLHLVVCHMEYQAMSILMGEDTARQVIGRMTHYQWIYDRVLNDSRVREVAERNGIVLSDISGD